LDEIMTRIRKIELPISGLERLQSEAREEGYNFIDTLVEQWANAENRFDAPGEALCGHLDQGLLVAVGGLNVDPFAGRPDMGRIRRVYVRHDWRNQGIGRALVRALVDSARNHFTCVRLRAVNTGAARLYERLGFAPISRPTATHMLVFNGTTTDSPPHLKK
jgi:GNAT superfamily N-acetyltransferase